MNIRVLFSYVLALSLAVSWLPFVKAVVDDDQAGVLSFQVKDLAVEVVAMVVPVPVQFEMAIPDEHVVIFRSAVFLPVSQERPPPMRLC